MCVCGFMNSSPWKLQFLLHFFHLSTAHSPSLSFSIHGGHKSRRLSGRLSTAQLLWRDLLLTPHVGVRGRLGRQGSVCMHVFLYVSCKNSRRGRWGVSRSSRLSGNNRGKENADGPLQYTKCFLCLWVRSFYCGNEWCLNTDKGSVTETGRKTCCKHFSAADAFIRLSHPSR